MSNMHLFGDAASLATPRAIREDLHCGIFVLRNPEPLQPYVRCIGDYLEHWSRETPEALFLAERDADGEWVKLSYRETRERVGAIAQGLLDLDLPASPLVVLSDNSLDHALLALAAMHVGRVICSVSSAYCRVPQDCTKIHTILDQLEPALVYASDATTYGAAMASWQGVTRRVLSRGSDEIAGAISFDALENARETPAVAQAFAAVVSQ